MLEVNYLKYFYVVAKEGGFTRAAKVLRIQQPAISKMVKQLEAQLGLPLFERHKNGVRMTPAGERIFGSCQLIFDQVEQIRRLSGWEKEECQGPLSFGVTDSVCSYLMPRVMREFLSAHPKVKPSLFAGASNLICEEILAGRIEFGIFFTHPGDAHFDVKELGQVPFVLVRTAGEPASKRLAGSFIISREVDYPKSRAFPVRQMLEENRVKVSVGISSNNLDAQKKMVLEGLGMALLPKFMVEDELRDRKLVAVPSERGFSYSLKFVRRKKKVLSRNAEAFLKVFKEKLAALER